MQVFTYRIGDELKTNYIRQIFLNELISSEYQSKYTQAISTDFDFWMAREDGKYSKPTMPEMLREVPNEWTNENKKNNKKKLKAIHDKILNVGKGSAGSLDHKKMADVIKEIIIECAALINDRDEWNKCCKHWEFYPISCSPITGVEGKKELMKVPDLNNEMKQQFIALQEQRKQLTKKKDNEEYRNDKEKLATVRKQLGKTIIRVPSKAKALPEQQKANLEKQEEALIVNITSYEAELNNEEQGIAEKEEAILKGVRGVDEFSYKRFHNKPGLWFIYMLNIAKRCKVFHQGKENMAKFVDTSLDEVQKNLNGQTQDTYVYEIAPNDYQFENTFDCLDPDERKDLYIDIGQFIFQVRQNDKRKRAGVPGFNQVLTYNMQGEPDGEQYNLFDNEQFMNFMKKLQEGTYLDGRKLLTIIEEDCINGQQGEESLLDYITGYVDEKYNTFIKENKSDSEVVDLNKIPIVIKILFYVIFNASDPIEGIAKDYKLDFVEDDDKKRSTSGKSNVDKSMGWGRFVDGYDFSSAIHGFIRSVTNRLYRVEEEFKEGRMKKNIRRKVEQLKLAQEGEFVPGTTDLTVKEVYNFLNMAVDVKKGVKEQMRAIMTASGNFADLEVEEKKKEEIMEEYKQRVYKLMDDAGHERFKEADYDYYFSKHSARFVKEEKNKHAKVIIQDGVIKFLTLGGGKKRKKRTRRKRKKKRKRTRKKRKRKKRRMKKKIIRLSVSNKKSKRKLIKVTKRRKRTRGRGKR